MRRCRFKREQKAQYYSLGKTELSNILDNLIAAKIFKPMSLDRMNNKLDKKSCDLLTEEFYKDIERTAYFMGIDLKELATCKFDVDNVMCVIEIIAEHSMPSEIEIAKNEYMKINKDEKNHYNYFVQWAIFKKLKYDRRHSLSSIAMRKNMEVDVGMTEFELLKRRSLSERS